MPNDNDKSATDSLHNRSDQLDRRLNRLWIPGRRKQIATDSYDVAYSWRELDRPELAITNFQRAIDAFHNKKPRKSKDSLSAFSLVAACHNHIGLIHLDDDNFSLAIANFGDAIQLRRLLKQLFPDNRENQIYLGGALCNLGLAYKPTSPVEAADCFRQSLSELQIPDKPCECSYWDEQRQSWWCEQLEALGRAAGFAWVDLAPRFIDNAMVGLDGLSENSET